MRKEIVYRIAEHDAHFLEHIIEDARYLFAVIVPSLIAGTEKYGRRMFASTG